jgi:hypothetical protein
VDGKATEAALAAVATALDVRCGAVTLVAGASGRTKIVDVADGDPRILADLLAGAERLALPGRRRAAAGFHLEDIHGKRDQGVVADQERQLDDSLLAEQR